MRACALSCAVAMVAVPASATNLGLVVDLLPGHAIYDEGARQAGVVRRSDHAGPGHGDRSEGALRRVACGCRAAARARPASSEVIFVVPHKAMAIEGTSADGRRARERSAGCRRRRCEGNARPHLRGRAGIPSGLWTKRRSSTRVACELDEPAWHVRWQDVRLLDGQEPDAVIDQAYSRFAAIHQACRPAKGSAQLASRAVGSSGLTRRALP